MGSVRRATALRSRAVPRAPGRRPDPPARPAPAAWGGLAWATLVGAALAWGTVSVADAGVGLRAAPLAGRWAWHGDMGLAPALAVGLAVVAGGPPLARRVSWRALLVLTASASAAWTVALAASGGRDRIIAPLTTRHEYEPFAAMLDDVPPFLAGFTAALADHPVHVQGHPPGPVLLAWGLDRLGLGGAGWLAALAIGAWGLAAAAVLVAARHVADEGAARRAAPALVVLPAAVWAGTSLDALFAGLTAAAGALAALAAVRWSPRLAAMAGLTAGVALLCTYGAALALIPPVVAGAALVARRAGDRATRPPGPGTLALAALAGVAAALMGAAVAGFWWFDGLAATRRAYWSGIGAIRPAGYTTLAGNPAALALATGPAVAAGLATLTSRVWAPLRPAGAVAASAPATAPTPGRAARTPAGIARSPLLLPGAALAAVALADLSQLSRGEVERIWLPFVPWLALAAPGHRRAWLVAQVAVAVVLESTLRSPW